jgi:hypothetical protein
MLTIMKNTLYGSVTGLILGGTLTLVVDKEDRDDVVRWGVVIGTFSGFAYGVYAAQMGEEDLLGRLAPAPRTVRRLRDGPLAVRLDPLLTRWPPVGAGLERWEEGPTPNRRI